MHADSFDVVIVGSGLAGFTAAALAAEQEQRVAVVSSGTGSCALRSCCVEVREASMLSEEPDLAAAFAFFRTLAQAAGTALVGSLEQTFHLPTLLGSFQPMHIAPLLVANARPESAERTRVIGLRGLTGFDAEFLAARFNQQATIHGWATRYDPHTVELSPALGRPLTTLRVAQAFDRNAAFRAELAAALAAARGNAERILLPAVLGIEAADPVRAVFASAVGCPLGELPTLPPSIPGLRLAHHLEAHLRARGVAFFPGYPVERLEIERGICTGVQIASPGRAFHLAAQCVVLATSAGWRQLLASAQAIDAEQRPLDAEGRPIAENLFAACALSEPQSTWRACRPTPQHPAPVEIATDASFSRKKPQEEIIPGNNDADFSLARRVLAGYRAALSASAERSAHATR